MPSTLFILRQSYSFGLRFQRKYLILITRPRRTYGETLPTSMPDKQRFVKAYTCIPIYAQPCSLFSRENSMDAGGRTLQCVACEKTGPCMTGHRVLFRRSKAKPAAQQPLGALQRIVIHQACSVACNFRPDVHLIADKHGTPDGEGFDHRDTEVLLMRRQDQGVARPQSTPFEVAANQAGPVDSATNAKPFGQALKFRLHPLLIGTGNHQIHSRNRVRGLGKRLDQQVAALLFMDTRKEKQIAAATKLRKPEVERLDLSSSVPAALLRIVDSNRNDGTVPLARAEARPGQIPLGFAGKDNRLRIAQHGMLQRPVNQLLEVLERILPVKPGIKRAVGKYTVALPGAARRKPNGKTGESPNPVHDDTVEAMGIGSKPAP